VVSERDLFSLQRLGLGEITTEIRLAGERRGARRTRRRDPQARAPAGRGGVAAEQLTLFVSVLNDRLCQRILEIERKKHHWDDISWCWLAFGSEGRFEQTFSTDQDNGMLFAAHDGTTADAVRARLLPFARA
jgi:CBS domain-containing protein